MPGDVTVIETAFTPPRAATRPTPTFTQAAGEVTGQAANETIPWAEVAAGTVPLAEPRGERTEGKLVGAHIHLHLASNHSPTAPSQCHPAPPPPPTCSPCCPSRLQMSSGCNQRCGVAHSPAMCGSGIVRFEQRMFVDDICHPAVYDNCHDANCRRKHHDN